MQRCVFEMVRVIKFTSISQHTFLEKFYLSWDPCKLFDLWNVIEKFFEPCILRRSHFVEHIDVFTVIKFFENDFQFLFTLVVLTGSMERCLSQHHTVTAFRIGCCFIDNLLDSCQLDVFIKTGPKQKFARIKAAWNKDRFKISQMEVVSVNPSNICLASEFCSPGRWIYIISLHFTWF